VQHEPHVDVALKEVAAIKSEFGAEPDRQVKTLECALQHLSFHDRISIFVLSSYFVLSW
jgi:hypothetical protein